MCENKSVAEVAWGRFAETTLKIILDIIYIVANVAFQLCAGGDAFAEKEPRESGYRQRNLKAVVQ